MMRENVHGQLDYLGVRRFEVDDDLRLDEGWDTCQIVFGHNTFVETQKDVQDSLHDQVVGQHARIHFFSDLFVQLVLRLDDFPFAGPQEGDFVLDTFRVIWINIGGGIGPLIEFVTQSGVNGLQLFNVTLGLSFFFRVFGMVDGVDNIENQVEEVLLLLRREIP